MGSEQSSQNSGGKRGKNPKRSQSARGDSIEGKQSPRPSICSDSDVPYVSYAVSRPIGEEPTVIERKTRWNESVSIALRTREKQISREQRNNKAKSAGSIVVVKAASEAPSLEKDPLFLRLAEIPTFVPIIRGSLQIPWTKDPEMSEKLDPSALYRVGLLYEERIRRKCDAVLKTQAELTGRIRTVDSTIADIHKRVNERQKQFGSYLNELSKVTELTASLSKCHCVLNDTLEAIETLNNTLPPDVRLEPFVWTTG